MKLLSKIPLITSAIVRIAILNISVLAYFNDLGQADAITVDLANKQIFFVQKIREHSLQVADGESKNRKDILELVDLYQTSSDLLDKGGVVNGSRVNSIAHLSPDLHQNVLNRWSNYKQNSLVVAEKQVFNLELLNSRDYVVQNSDDLISKVEMASHRLEGLAGDFANVRPTTFPSFTQFGFEQVAVSKVMEALGPRLSYIHP